MIRSLPSWAREVAGRLTIPAGGIIIDGLWANPPGALIDRVYQEAKNAIPRTQGCSPTTPHHQAWLRKVHTEFHRRLRDRGIYVEGADAGPE